MYMTAVHMPVKPWKTIPSGIAHVDRVRLFSAVEDKHHDVAAQPFRQRIAVSDPFRAPPRWSSRHSGTLTARSGVPSAVDDLCDGLE